jgi:hypothetical protein
VDSVSLHRQETRKQMFPRSKLRHPNCFFHHLLLSNLKYFSFFSCNYLKQWKMRISRSPVIVHNCSILLWMTYLMTALWTTPLCLLLYPFSSPLWPQSAGPSRLSLLKMIYDMVNTFSVRMNKMVRQLGVRWRGSTHGTSFLRRQYSIHPSTKARRLLRLNR